MTRAKSWFRRVLVLLEGGNTKAALAQIRAAPSVAELKQLRSAIDNAALKGRWPGIDDALADQVDALSAPRLHRSP